MLPDRFGHRIFAVLVAVAVGKVRRPDVHKRLLLLATSNILAAALFRPLLIGAYTLMPALLPSATTGAHVLSILLMLPAFVRDWRTRGRIHPVYVVVVPILLVLQIAPLKSIPFMPSLGAAAIGIPHRIEGPECKFPRGCPPPNAPPQNSRQ